MSDPRLSSPSSIRLVAAAAAAVGALGVVALGVQLGTSGLVGDGPGRNPGSATATPASATVELPRSRPGATLEQTLVSLFPAAGATAFGSSTAAGATPLPAPAPSAGDGGTGPAPSPNPPPTTPPLPTTPVTPPTTPSLPAPPATIPPALDPVVEVVDDALSDVAEATTETSTSPNANTDPVGSVLRVLLGD